VGFKIAKCKLSETLECQRQLLVLSDFDLGLSLVISQIVFHFLFTCHEMYAIVYILT